MDRSRPGVPERARTAGSSVFGNQAELLQHGKSVIDAELLGDQATVHAQHGGSSEAHLLARALWEGTDGQIAEGFPGVRAAAFPLPDHILALGDEIGGAPEIQ